MYNDFGLFIALISTTKVGKTPSNSFNELFINDDCNNKGIFPLFVDEVNSYLKDGKKVDNYLYNPIGYSLYGKHDILLLSLIDDIEFGTKTFEPYSPGLSDKHKKGFDYQVFNSLHNKNSLSNNIFDIRTIFQDEKFTLEYPFVCISQFKLNTLLLIGNGQDYVNYVYKNIDLEYKKLSIQDNFRPANFTFVIVESVGSHELILITFSKSVKTIRDFLFKIRELSINDNSDENDEDYVGIIKNSLLQSQLNNQDCKKEQDANIIDNHLFNDSTSIFGCSLYNDTAKFINSFTENEDDILKMQTKWFVKPGHYRELYAELNKEYSNIGFDNTPYLSIGRGDMIIGDFINLKIKDLSKLNNILYNEKITTHVKEMTTSVNFKLDANILENYQPITNEHTNEITSKYIIEQSIINELESKLKSLNISKLLTQRVLSLCNLFNIVVTDIVLVGNFIELDSFIKVQIIDYIFQYYEEIALNKKNEKIEIDKEALVKKIKSNCEYAEHAFYDRFFQTHRTSELTDINLDYNGSIQQILSVYDTLFRYLVFNINNSKTNNYLRFYAEPKINRGIAHTCTFITHKLNVKCTESAIFLNYHHIFYPSTFLSIIIHEVSNYYIDSLMSEMNFHINALADNDESLDEKIAVYNNYLCYFNTENFNEKTFLKCDPNSVINIKTLLKSTTTNEKFIKIFEAHKDLTIYFLADAFTFSLSFHCDKELYRKWHVSYLLLQANHLYETTHKIKAEEIFVNFFRYFSILNTFKIKYTIEEEIEEIINLIPDFYNYIDYKKIIIEVDKIIKNIQNVNELTTFYGIIYSLSKDKYKSLYNKDVIEMDKDFLESNIENFVKGNLVDLKYSNGDENTAFNYRLSMFLYTIVHLVFEDVNHKKGINVIERFQYGEEQGKIRKDQIPFTADRAIDSLGGFFTTTPEIRRKIFQYNAVIYKSLWHFTQLYKKEYFY